MKNQCVHSLSDHDCSQSILTPKVFLSRLFPLLFFCYSSLFSFLAKFPSSPFLCAFHLYLSTLTVRHLFYPWLHGRRGKRKKERKKDNERKNLHCSPHLLSFLKASLCGAAGSSSSVSKCSQGAFHQERFEI